jgi:catechol 2,3-dioxygenase-like lactoylglutathione lyase family enzyme
VATELTHLFMRTRDLSAAKHFWVEQLGLEVLADAGGYLRVGGGRGFHIGLEQGDPGPANATEVAVRVDDVDAVYQRLAQTGVQFESAPEDQEWGARHAWLRDHDGRRMSIYS